jgi:folate-binding Fe-S cluster repair protein YgfZ
MTSPFSALLRSRSVVRIAGSDTLKFLQVPRLSTSLTKCCTIIREVGIKAQTVVHPVEHIAQGLTTRNVLPLESEGAAPVYTCILNSKGRQLFDLFLHKDPASGMAVFVDCPASDKQKLITTLLKFKLRSALTIEDASETLQIMTRWQHMASAESLTNGGCEEMMAN